MSVITISASGSSVAIRILGAALVARLTPGHPITAARLVAMVISCRQYSVEKMSALTNPKWIDFYGKREITS